jgi:hypothetical protein
MFSFSILNLRLDKALLVTAAMPQPAAGATQADSIAATRWQQLM